MDDKKEQEAVIAELKAVDNPFVIDPQLQKELVVTRSKLTDTNIKRLEHCFSLDSTVAEACYFCNISKETFYNWMKKTPNLKEHLDRLRERPILLARKSMLNGMKNPEFALKYAKNKRNKEFSEKTEVEQVNHSGAKSLTELNGWRTKQEEQEE